MIKLTSRYRTHTCGELRATAVGATVTLSGWIQRKRDHGGVVFVDLRDHYGVTQVVFADALRERIQETRVESVIQIIGEVAKRSTETVNARIATGEVEVHVSGFEVLGDAAVLPFQIAEDDHAPENTRLEHRFLELRRDKLHSNILTRNEVIHSMREIMRDRGFREFQTPILTSSSPEGARDFVVPSRVHPGKFFALPQAPQQFKQLLMVSGFDRYFQIAPCFRDEDSRADRSPGEFYQLDLEMSFVEERDVQNLVEGVCVDIFRRFSKKLIPEPFPRIGYNESHARFGTDKPDLRNPLELVDLSEVFKTSEFRVFREAVDQGGKVRAIKVELPTVPSRKYFDDLIEWFKKLSGQGLAYLIFEADGHKGTIAKFMGEQEIAGIRSALEIKPISVVFFGAGSDKNTLPALGRLRTKLGEDFKLLDESRWGLCWITDFPMYEADDKTGEIMFGHNPFSMPHGGLEALNTKDPLTISAPIYDVVCNGYELGTGAIRNHRPDVMYRAFEVAGYKKETVDSKFPALLKAFQYGAPPHGGLALGVERIVMLLCGEEAIREVIPFPLAQTVEDLMMSAPSELSAKQLKEVHIALALPPVGDK